jgi:uncharacterized protein HemX
MITLQKTLVATAIALALGAGLYEAWQAATLRGQVQAFQRQKALLAEQLRQFQRERDAAINRLALRADELAALRGNPKAP